MVLNQNFQHTLLLSNLFPHKNTFKLGQILIDKNMGEIQEVFIAVTKMKLFLTGEVIRGKAISSHDDVQQFLLLLSTL